jgi:hypothetical protein
MSYKVLLIDKNITEVIGDYEVTERGIHATEISLKLMGDHEVTTVTETSDITDQLYTNHDCVLLHPSPSKLVKIVELHVKYPQVGLIVVPSALIKTPAEKEAYHTLEKDPLGVFYLMKPYFPSELISSIERVVQEARKEQQQ